MKALIFQGKVVQVEPVEFEVSPTMFWVDCPDDCIAGWGYGAQGVERPVANPETMEEIMVEYNGLMQEFIDGVAMEKGYNSSLHCASYSASTIAGWKAEADAFITWRDSVWVYALAELAKFQSGERELIPFGIFKEELPVIAWPV